MSRPAISCARRKHEPASSYCSRYRELTLTSRKPFGPCTAVYQAGRGSEPMMEVGRAIPADALYIVFLACWASLAFPLRREEGSVHKSYASLFAAAFFTKASSGFGSGAPESRKRLTMG